MSLKSLMRAHAVTAEIVGLWGDAPTRANVLANSRDLASYPAFGPVSFTDLRRAAGVWKPSHPLKI